MGCMQSADFAAQQHQKPQPKAKKTAKKRKSKAHPVHHVELVDDGATDRHVVNSEAANVPLEPRDQAPNPLSPPPATTVRPFVD